MSCLALRFLRVPLSGQTWLNLLYLLLAFPLGLAYVIVLGRRALGRRRRSPSCSSGSRILLATLVAWRGMAALERTLARVAAAASRIHPPPERHDLPPWRVQLWLRDPVTWKSLVFVVAKLPMGIVAFAAIRLLGLRSRWCSLLRAGLVADHAGDLLRLGDRHPLARGAAAAAGRRPRAAARPAPLQRARVALRR